MERRKNTAGTVRAFLFPGHTVRLGMAGPRVSPAAGGLYAAAEKIFGRDLSALTASGPLEELRRTSNAQPAVFLAAMSPFLELAGLGLRPALACGRSLGDLTALTASGALPAEEALRVIKARSDIFERVIKRSPGRMSVILGLGESGVRNVCAEAAAGGGVCVIAGMNTDKNFVISGTVPAVDAAERLARGLRAHVMDISMPGAFHSPLMKEAEAEFGEFLEKVEFGPLSFPVIDDRSPSGFVEPGGERAFLSGQVSAPVDWRRRTDILRSAGANLLCELGPSQGMARIAAGSIPGCAWEEAGDAAAAASLVSEGAI